MLATFDYIKDGRADEALMVSEQLLHDKHDLIQKAVGWMLREIGKRVDRSVLLQFLDEHAATMPRTTLRYAIEHLGTEQRTQYLRLKNGSA
jgi:3-methyladenine DNA glycosylase AlkD